MLVMFGLAAFIAVVGGWLASRGSANYSGILIIVVVFVAAGALLFYSARRSLRKAMPFIGADGTSMVRIDATGVTVADTFVPFERVTCVVAYVQGEIYEGSARGVTEGSAVGRAIGSNIANGQRRRLYTDGALSGISVLIGVDRAASLGPSPILNITRAAPRRGDDPASIVIPLGAFFGIEELRALFRALTPASEEHGFPLGGVDGALSWGGARAAADHTREYIRKELPGLFDH